MSAMKISLQFGGIAAAAADAGRIADNIDRAGRSAQSVSQKLRFLGGPNQRLLQISDQRGRLGQVADSAQRSAISADLDLAQFRAQRSIALGQRAQQRGAGAPGLLEMVGKIASSVGGSGGGGVGAVAGAAGGLAETLGGVAAAAGPVGIALAVGKVAVDLFVAGIKLTVGALADFRTGLNATGGSQADMAKLTAFGIGGDAGGLASRLRHNLSSDPTAMMFGSRIGLGPRVGGAFGKVNEANDLVKAIEGLRGITNRDERIRTARGLGMEDLLKFADVSKGVFQSMKEDAAVVGQVLDSASQVDTANLSAQWGRYTQALKLEIVEIFKPIQPVLAALLGNMATFGRGLLSLWESGPGKVLSAMGRLLGTVLGAGEKLLSIAAKSPIVEKLFKVIDFVFDAIAKVIDTATSALDKALGTNSGNKVGDALDRHANAMNRHSDAMNRSGTFGGSDRARGALGPSSLGVGARTRALELNALQLGFWGF